jgi:hypothetical protein
MGRYQMQSVLLARYVHPDNCKLHEEVPSGKKML